MTTQGWYPDPDDPSAYRWWDGVAWGPSTRAAATSSRPRWHFIAAAAAVIAALTGAVLIGAWFVRGEKTAPTPAASHEAPTPSPTPTTSPTLATTTLPRAEYQAAYDAEAVRACEAIKQNPGLPTETEMRWDPEWSAIDKSERSLQSEINDCAKPARDDALRRIAEAEAVARQTPQQRAFLGELRSSIPPEMMPDSLAIDSGQRQCAVITDFMDQEISESLTRSLLVGTLRDTVAESPNGAQIRTVLWFATQHLCPENHAYAREAFPSGP